MTKKAFVALFKRKIASLALVALTACAISILMYIFYRVALLVMPASWAALWKTWLSDIFSDPDTFREWLLSKGAAATVFFVGAQILQVIFAPIPGQVVALVGGFVFGFWRGWAMTTLGLFIGSALAMSFSRVLGKRFVRKLVSDDLINKFDNLICNGGYTTFFMIFLLPALPDDAVCFMAGLTRLRLLPLAIVCLLGRAPGMMVLSLVGAGLNVGLTLEIKILFAALMLASIPLWLFSEIIEEKIRKFVIWN